MMWSVAHPGTGLADLEKIAMDPAKTVKSVQRLDPVAAPRSDSNQLTTT